jgi:hypothetical protein
MQRVRHTPSSVNGTPAPITRPVDATIGRCHSRTDSESDVYASRVPSGDGAARVSRFAPAVNGSAACTAIVRGSMKIFHKFCTPFVFTSKNTAPARIPPEPHQPVLLEIPELRAQLRQHRRFDDLPSTELTRAELIAVEMGSASTSVNDWCDSR